MSVTGAPYSIYPGVNRPFDSLNYYFTPLVIDSQRDDYRPLFFSESQRLMNKRMTSETGYLQREGEMLTTLIGRTPRCNY